MPKKEPKRKEKVKSSIPTKNTSETRVISDVDEMFSIKMLLFLKPEDRRNKFVIYHTLRLHAAKSGGELRRGKVEESAHEVFARLCLTDLDSLEKALDGLKKCHLVTEDEDGTLRFLDPMAEIAPQVKHRPMSCAERARRYRARQKERLAARRGE